MHSLQQYIRQYSPALTDDEFQQILAAFIPKTLHRKQFFLHEGQVCKHFAFILKGAMRQYCVDEEGRDQTTNLYVENWWAGDRESWVNGTPSRANIEAWEDCNLLLVTHEDSQRLACSSPSYNHLLLKLDEQSNIAAQKRIVASIGFSAKERYQNLIETYPKFFERFPQHIIASYLGITKETLSRIRGQKAKG